MKIEDRPDEDVLALASRGDQSAILEHMKRLGHRSPFYFSKAIAGYQELTPHFHQPLCNWLARNTPKRRGLLCPRKYFKSSMLKGYVLRELTEPGGVERRFLFVGENEDVGAKNVTDIQWKFREDKRFQAMYPHLIPKDLGRDWPASALTLPRSRSYDEPTIQAIGIGTKHTGFHYTDIVLDDPIGFIAAKSKPEMQKSMEWFKTIPGLTDSIDSRVLYIGTRWKHGAADLPGWIMRELGAEWEWIVRDCIENDQSIFPPEIAATGKRIGYSIPDLMQMKKEMGTYLFNCFPSGTPVLMSDWSEKKIEDIKIGESVIGFTVNPGRGSGKTSHRLIPSKVLAVGKRISPVIRITTSVGRIVYCTPDHKWWTGRSDTGHKSYLPAGIKRKLFSVFTPFPDPSSDEQRIWDWLGGMLDGEGSVSSGNVFICQSPDVNPTVCRGIEDAFDRLGLSWYPNPKSNSYHLRGGRSLIIRILKNCMMYKRDRFVNRLWKRNGQLTENGGVHRIVSITFAGEQTVYNITTETGNYVAYGYATKNCNMRNNPTAGEDSDFKESDLKTYKIADDRKGAILSDSRERVELAGLYRISFLDPSTGGISAEAENAIIIAGEDWKGRILVLDRWHKNCSMGVAVEQQHLMNDKWRCSRNYYEAVGAHKEAGEKYRDRTDLDGKCRKCGRLHRSIRAVPIIPPPGLKEDRIRDYMQTPYEEGRIYIGDWMSDVEKQILEFPHGELVDMLDALAYCVKYSKKPPRYDAGASESKKKDSPRAGHPRVHSSIDYGGYS